MKKRGRNHTHTHTQLAWIEAPLFIPQTNIHDILYSFENSLDTLELLSHPKENSRPTAAHTILLYFASLRPTNKTGQWRLCRLRDHTQCGFLCNWRKMWKYCIIPRHDSSGERRHAESVWWYVWESPRGRERERAKGSTLKSARAERIVYGAHAMREQEREPQWAFHMFACFCRCCEYEHASEYAIRAGTMILAMLSYSRFTKCLYCLYPDFIHIYTSGPCNFEELVGNKNWNFRRTENHLFNNKNAECFIFHLWFTTIVIRGWPDEYACLEWRDNFSGIVHINYSSSTSFRNLAKFSPLHQA